MEEEGEMEEGDEGDHFRNLTLCLLESVMENGNGAAKSIGTSVRVECVNQNVIILRIKKG